MITFAHPLFFSLMIFLPLIFFLKDQKSGKIRYSSLKILKASLVKKQRFHPRIILLLLRVFTLVLFILALARPQVGKTLSEVSSEGIDIMLALDTSESMRALDFKKKNKPVERLEIVKDVVRDFIKNRTGDRMGLIVFGEDAFTQCPLTLDHGILMDFIDKIEVGMAGKATAIGQALALGVNRVKDVKRKSKIIILLTDGRSNAGHVPPEKAAVLAKKYHIKVYTIGVGTKGKAPFLVKTVFGSSYAYQNVDIDEKTLRSIAELTGGRYYRATDKDELEEIYREIDQLETTEIKIKEYTEYKEIFGLFILMALFLLSIEIILSQTVLRKIP